MVAPLNSLTFRERGPMSARHLRKSRAIVSRREPVGSLTLKSRSFRYARRRRAVSFASPTTRLNGFRCTLAIPGSPVFFKSSAWAFAEMEVGAGTWSVRFVDHQGKSLHCCTAVGPGMCEPRPCAP